METESSIENDLPPEYLTATYPLHIAASQGHNDVLTQLLQAGCYVNTTNFDSVTPLHEACFGGHFSCIKLLLQAGAKVNARNIDGSTPLCEASSNGQTECVQYLLDNGAELNPMFCYTTPLHEAVLRGNTDVAQCLIQHGCFLDATDMHFGTPLHVATYKDNYRCAQALLVSGANVNACKSHWMPLHNAAQNRNADMLELLISHGADINKRNNQGQTATDMVPKTSHAYAMLHYCESYPRSLRQWCRWSIRKQLGPRCLYQVHMLGLPKTLADYLLFKQ